MSLRAIALLAVVVGAFALAPATVPAAPDGQLTWAVHFTIAPVWLDPGEHTQGVTPLFTYYALHDALAKPMPGNAMAPSLAESWSVSRDWLTYEFVLRRDVRFHNGDVMTAEDVKFSFERYRGVSAKTLRDAVTAVEVVDPHRVRFRLKEPWPDFLAFYATPATGAAWIVPKKYVERVGNDGFARAPVGAGPYRFVSFNPGAGVELVLEAHEGYWRKAPAVKRLVFRMVPDESTRLAMLKRSEVDIAHALRGPLGREVERTPGLKLIATQTIGSFFVSFTDQWNPKSPWHDQRVRLAASVAIDREAISRAETLGFAKPAASIVPPSFEFAWPAPPIRHDAERARKLLAEAGYPRGFDGGDYTADASFTDLAEAVVTNLNAVGIRTHLRALERAAFFAQIRDRRAKNLIQTANGAYGNAATRIEREMTAAGFTYGSYPDIDDLFRKQTHETDRKKRELMLHQIQKIASDRARFAPIWQFAQLHGVGPRVEESGLGLIELHPFSSPYEDLRLRR